MDSSPNVKECVWIQQLIYGWLLLLWIGRAVQGLLLVSLCDSPLVYVSANNAFWLYWLLGIPSLFQGNWWVALFLDGLLLVAAIGGVTRQQGRWPAVLSTFLLLNYYFYFNSVAAHHEHTLLGIVFCLPLLWFRSWERFVLFFVGLRYYVLWVMISAAGWKWHLGSWWVPHQMAEILKQQHLVHFLQSPDSTYTHLIRWLIEHPTWANILWYLGWGVESSFIIGFFTRRWDKVLACFFLGFFIADYALLGISFLEFCIFGIVFYPWKSIWAHYDTFITQNTSKT